MEQQDYLVADAPVGVEEAPVCADERWPLQLEVQVVDFLSNYTVPGVLQGFTPGEVTILLNEPVSEQRSVSVNMHSFVFEGQTLYCQPREDKFEAHITIDDIDANGLRRAPRFPIRVPGELFLPCGEPVAMTIVDISSDGLGIEAPVALEVGQPVAVGSQSVLVLATIRHCRQLAEGVYRAGAEMHHLFETNVEPPKGSPRANFLQSVMRKRYSKGAGLKLAFR